MRPRQLLRGPAHLVDREAARAVLDRSSGRDIVMITGGGSGKTVLAPRWMHGVAAEFPDGQLFADLRGCSGSSARPGEMPEHVQRIRGAAAQHQEVANRFAAGIAYPPSFAEWLMDADEGAAHLASLQ